MRKTMHDRILPITTALAAASLSASASASFVGFVVTKTSTSNSGVALDVYTVWARFNGPTDTVLNAFDFNRLDSPSTNIFYHKDNAYYNSGVLQKAYGTWRPSESGSSTLNRPFDSFLTVGGTATPTNTTSADPSWPAGGGGWNRPDVPNGWNVGWFNNSPPNFQGRVGVGTNTATDVRLGQFVVDSGVNGGTWNIQIGWNNGVAGSGVQFSTGTFQLYICPTWYQDADGDGFGSASSGTQVSCTQPTGYVANSSDCNDALVTYADNDGDAFGAGAPTACGVASNTDCDDANAALNPNTVWYADLDGDGFGSSGGGSLIQCAQPTGYVLNSTDNCPSIANPGQEDCNASGTGDACEIASGALLDCDTDGIPDVCEGGSAIRLASPLLAPFGNGFPANHTFSGLSRSYGSSVRLHIDAIADLDLSSEFIAASFDGSPQEFFFVNGGVDCPATPIRATKTFTTAAFNALVADGALTVNLVASGTVSATQCPNGGITLRLEYEAIQPGNDCNLNGQLDSCELGNGLAFDCNGNGRLDSCDVAAGLGTDCNSNGKLDSCDLASGISTDLNGNGVLDECAGEWIVGGSGFATIQAAIDAAPSGTTIRVGRGTYAGPIVIDSKRIVLASLEGYLFTTITGGGGDTSLLHLTGAGAGSSGIYGFTFRDGSIGHNFGGFRVGGAVSVISVPSVTINGCLFTGNSTAYGGALYAYGGSGTIVDSIFAGNSATVDGGGLQIGGGANWQVTRCVVTSNVAPVGAGMHTWSSSVGLADTRFLDNSATSTGGAISWYTVGSTGLLLDGCTLEGNSAGAGGGIAVLGGAGSVGSLRTRYCTNVPQNVYGPVIDLGQNIFSQDCDGDGVCDDEEIALAASASFSWPSAAGGNGKRYLRVTAPNTWERANSRAQAIGGHLATITSAAEQSAVHGALGGAIAWLGASQPSNAGEPGDGWSWVTGEPWDYTNWSPGEPNENSGAYGEDRLAWLAGGAWNDGGCPGGCFLEYGSIIEIDEASFNRSRDCNSNGVTDGCDIDAGAATDCNGNSIPDSCDIASGVLGDCDANGVADLCELGRTTAWGENNNGQSTIPASADRAHALAAGCNHGLAISGSGVVTAWGSNTFGQSTVPASVVNARRIAAGCDHSLAALADGTVVAWGYNAFGQCAVPLAANGSVAQIVAGANHSGVRKTNGGVVLWGRNIDGECNAPAALGPVAGLALGGAHSMGLRLDGSVACWGLNNFGQCSTPASVGTLRAIAAGCYHSVGLRTDGTVVAWGSTIFGQTAVPAGLADVVAISAGSGQHTLALRANGSVVAWGWNAFAQSTVPAGVTGIGEIAAGGTFSLARRASSVDCNGNGTIDSCEIAGGTAPDCNGNGVPDACDVFGGTTDCNLNGVPDSCEIAANDCNGNGTLDSCDLASGSAFDCNGNGTLDSCDAAAGGGTDCNGNGKLDSCDLASGASTDLNGNGVLDECAGELVVGGSGFRTIQAAVDAAPAGSTIRIGTGTYAPVDLAARSLNLEAIGALGSVVVDGGGSAPCIRMFNTDGASPIIARLVLRNGGGTNGGGLSIELSSPVVIDCLIENCSATSNGGGVLANGSAGRLEGCTIRSCTAAVGGGVSVIGFSSAGAFRVVNCVFDGNSAGASGGSIYNKTQFVLTGSSVTASSAPLGAGAHFDPVGSAQMGATRFCLNLGANVDGPYSDLGGNVLSQDCNGNGICDADEIAGGGEADCDANGIPDSCQLSRATAWGENIAGQATVPASLGPVRSISAGCTHALAIRADGTLRAWGSNSFGQATVPAIGAASLIAAGCDHNLVLAADGTLHAWGYNAFGQCAIPSAANGGVVEIAAGANHSGVRKSDGSLVLWGRNVDGECNVPPGVGPAAQLALGGAHSVARRADGSVVCWGLNNFGQCNVPLAAGVLSDIAAGCYHTVGVRSNGTVVAWGSSIFGQTSVPAGLSGVVDVAAGSGQHTVALRADGTVTSWGWNAFGQATVPADLAGIAEISAGGAFSLVRSAGSGDCDDSGAIDSCEIASNPTLDCNGNGTIDACDLAGGAPDCNGNGTLDSCEIAGGAAADCNGNGVPDSCDLAAGTSTDLNSNGVPDECAGEWVVGGSGFRTVQAAVAAAPGGTTIRVAPGTYSGGVVIDGKSLELRSLGGAGSTILSGSGLVSSIIAVRSSAANGTVIDGFTFRDGNSGTAAFDTLVGGAVFLDQVSATVRNCRFLDNSSSYGGAIYAIGYSGTIENCVFDGNSATFNAGAVQIGFGGTVDFRGNLLENNSAAGGGAMHVVYWDSGPTTSVALTNCTFRGNTATEEAGAVFWYAASGANLPVTGCTVESNTAPDAAFTRIGGTLAFDFLNTRFCLNKPENVIGAINDLGGNTFSQDCNRNGVCDADEIASGAAADCNANGIPDSCELAGELLAFGYDGVGQLDVPANLPRATAIATGCDHSMVLLADGTVRAWGQNTFGQASVPPTLPAIASITAGCDHSVALGTNGTVYAWGYNLYGQCNVPTAANGSVAQIAAGANHTGVRKTNGSLFLWGRNVDGECIPPSTLGPAAELALGGAHSVARRPDGTIAAWGLNNFGQCNVPANAGTLQSIAAGCYHTVGLRTNGTVVAWGSSIFGQTSVPAGLNGVVAIAAGSGQHTLALRGDGSVVAWGWNAFGQASVPAAATDVFLIAAGGTHSMALTKPAADCNGNNQLDSCELANGTQSDCNANGILDSCELASGAAADCNANGTLDSCDIAAGIPDCNSNGRPDTCDLASGPSTDLNGNSIPDECAGEFVVGGSGYASIQPAINAAPDGATIRVAAGTWPPFSVQGRRLSIVSLAGKDLTFVDGGGSQRASILSNIAPREVLIQGFTFRNGSAADGAGMKLVLASPTVVDCVFENNVASGPGGGICCFSGGPLFDGCVIRNNAAQRGGGAWLTGLAENNLVAQFNNCVISFNDASAGGGGVGNEGRLFITSCTVESNAAGTVGGGLLTTGVSGATGVGASFFCMNMPGNISGPYSEISPNVLGDDCNLNGACDIDEIADGAEDKNQNNQLDSCELARGDLNLDGAINAADLAVLLNFWGAVNPPAGDLNGDGIITGADLTVMLNNWDPV